MSTASLLCYPTVPLTWLDSTAATALDLLAAATNGVCVVRCPLNLPIDVLAKLTNTLSYDEQKQSERYRQAADRRRFVVGRGGLRWLVGYVTGRPPTDVVFVRGEYGKPELSDEPGWYVNVSHAGEWVLLAMARQPVGVDVEWNNPDFQYQDLLPTCFSPAEQEALRAAGRVGAAAERHLFYTLWTRKEALLKATGLGLTDQLTAISVLDGPQTAPAPAIGADGSWYLQSFAVFDKYPAALACPSAVPIQAFTLTDQ